MTLRLAGALQRGQLLTLLALSPRHWAEAKPYWWIWAVSACAWLGLCYRLGLGADLAVAMGDVCRTRPALTDAAGVLRAVAGGYADWGLMVLAMMLPLTGEAAANVASAQPWHRRQRSIAVFLSGYLLLWMALGLVLQLAIVGLGLWLPSSAGAAGFAGAAGWIWSTARRRAQIACSHTIPLRIRGWRAERDCLRYGVLIGWACIRSCWAAMAALMLASHGLGMMALVAALLFYERAALTHRSKALGYAWAAMAAWLALSAIV